MALLSPLRPLTLIALFLWLLVSILLISATGDPLFVTADLGGGAAVHLGAFTICATGLSCSSVTTSCGYSFQGQSSTLPGTCSTFQAFRAFLIMGLLLALGITIACYAIFLTRRTASSALNWLMLGLSLTESFFIMIAFSCVAGWYNNLGSGFSYGPSFGLLVSAWVLGLFATGFWFLGCAWEDESGAGRQSSSSWGGDKAAATDQAAKSNGSAEMQQQQTYNGQPEQPGAPAAYNLPAPTYAAQPQGPVASAPASTLDVTTQ